MRRTSKGQPYADAELSRRTLHEHSCDSAHPQHCWVPQRHRLYAAIAKLLDDEYEHKLGLPTKPFYATYIAILLEISQEDKTLNPGGQYTRG